MKAPRSFGTVVLVGGVAWLAVGLMLALVMGRRGHDAFSWLILGTLFGPLGAVFAIEARSEEFSRPELVAPRQSGAGPVDVLVGFDGSAESRAALAAVADLLGPRVGRALDSPTRARAAHRA
ncbi:MAG: universal stress protein, partial [Acidimicrobiia bacterium]